MTEHQRHHLQRLTAIQLPAPTPAEHCERTPEMLARLIGQITDRDLWVASFSLALGVIVMTLATGAHHAAQADHPATPRQALVAAAACASPADLRLARTDR